MRVLLFLITLFACLSSARAQQVTPLDGTNRYPRSLFSTAEASNATPFPHYQPALVDSLIGTQERTDRQLFDLINEAAVRHDPSLQHDLNLHEKELGYIPRLAVAHYKWVFGDKSQLNWLMSEAQKSGLGGDSLILTVFGYMDEWDRTIRWLKQNDAYDENSHRHDAAGGEIVSAAIEARKRLYGAKRFQQAWDAVKTNSAD